MSEEKRAPTEKDFLDLIRKIQELQAEAEVASQAWQDAELLLTNALIEKNTARDKLSQAEAALRYMTLEGKVL